jgi:tetratricopeptide (TPR) repeat protein
VAPVVRLDAGVPPPWREPVGACIGSGGFASVWAIPGGVLKVAHADHDLARARMAREAHALAAIGPPAVPRLVDHGVLADGRAWIAMERVAGDNLADLLTAPIALDRALAIATGILDALAAIHAAGFVHRDVKPDNIVRQPDSSIAVLDLGLARKLPVDPDDPTRPGVVVGSPEYLPPEQVLDAASVDARADLYAFGCVLYELCTGRPPFLGDATALERAHAALRPPALGALAAVPLQIEAVCHDCLAKLPPRRPASAAEVRARIAVPREELSLARVHSVSMVSEGKQPVVLLWAELPHVGRALLGALAARKVTVISQRGRRILGGVLGAAHADPAGAAIAAARDLAAAGARVALHLDLLHVTPRLTGPAAEHPDSWLPPATWIGVVLTRALATVIQAPTRPSELGAGFVALAEAGATTELFGRDELISELATEATAALGGAGPGFALLIGDHGSGKSSVVTALEPGLIELGARVHVGACPPPGSGLPGTSPLAGLIDTPSGPIVRSVGDRLRAIARDRPLAIVLDDAHLADHALLDALEYATLGGEPLALWVLALATPRIDQRRPGLGERAERHHRAVLEALDEESAVAMSAALLRPAVYPPLRALRQLVALAHGHPLHLVSLVREIHDRGAIRTRPNGEHFLDTTALDALPPVALGPWLAARELAGHSVELVALARVCAVLGDEFERGEVSALVEQVERTGGASTTIDVDVGLAELAEAGILVASGVASGKGWAFRQALLQEGVYATTNEDERRALHQAALELWSTRDRRDPGVVERVARHAEAVGELRTAARAFATLGERAHRAHRPLEALQAWQGAVRNLDVRDQPRARALLGRARALYRLQRVRNALEDLDAALAIARGLGDARLEVEVLLERATALDWSDDYAGSTAVAELAIARHREAQIADMAPAIALARARIVYRQARLADAIPLIDEVVALARREGDAETETIALVMLGVVLAEAKQLDRAEVAFRELTALCERRDDRFHLGAAYSNRMILWTILGQAERAEADLRTVIQLARETGLAALERSATHNLAEQRLWQGALDEALSLARRGLSLQRGHGEGSTWVDELLLARIFAARGDVAEARGLLDEIARHDIGDDNRIIVGVLQACVAPTSPATWSGYLARADTVFDDDVRLELALLAHRHCALSPEKLAEVRALAQRHPVWSRRHAF